jgi:hypothetical protein
MIQIPLWLSFFITIIGITSIICCCIGIIFLMHRCAKNSLLAKKIDMITLITSSFLSIVMIIIIMIWLALILLYGHALNFLI